MVYCYSEQRNPFTDVNNMTNLSGLGTPRWFIKQLEKEHEKRCEQFVLFMFGVWIPGKGWMKAKRDVYSFGFYKGIEQ